MHSNNYHYPSPPPLHNGYTTYPFQIVPHQRIWIQPYSNEGPLIYQNYPYHSIDQQQQQQLNNSNRSFYSQNQRRKYCYGCGSPHHLRAQCPQFQANPDQR